MGLNLKSKITFDNKEVVKGTKESKEAVKAFSKTSEGFIDSFAGVFGTSMGQISGSVKAFQGAIISMSGSQQAAAASSGALSKALRVFKIALAATGIGALVVALGSLVAYFTKSQDGADKLSRMMEPLRLAFALVTDAAAAIGRAIVNAFTSPKQAISDLWNFVKDQIVNRFTGLGKVFSAFGDLLISVFKLDGKGIKEAFNSLNDAAAQTITGMDAEQRKSVAERIKLTAQEVARRTKLAGTLNDREKELERQRIAFIERRARLEAQIAELRVQAMAKDLSVEARLEAQQKAMELTRQMYAEESRLESEAAKILEGRLSLSENMREDERGLAEQKAKVIALQTRQSNAMRELLERYNTLTALATKEREEREKVAILEERRRNAIPTLPKIEAPPLTVPIKFPTPAEIRAEVGDLMSAGQEIQTQFLDFSNIIGSGIASLGESLGNLFATGDIGEFSDALLGTFGNLIKQLGQMVLQLGLGLLSAQLALKSINPFVAIAAGTALIALGSAFARSTQQLGNSIANAGALNGSGTINTMPATNAANMDRQVVQVVVSGELKARGNTLVGVIANENNRRNLTT